jgi:2Fe-2S ferredoxin
MEESMLSFAAAAESNSRLSCQITMCEALNGLIVRMPEGQH